MIPFSGLVLKELRANKKHLMIPVWYLLVSYILIAISMTIATVRGEENITINGIPLKLIANADLHVMMSFAVQAAMFFGFLGFGFAITVIILSSTMLNQDIKNKCELFHRSQPVSAWQISGSRFIAGVGGPIALAFILGIVHLILSVLVVGIMTPMKINLWMSMNGFILSWAHFSIAILVLGSILFLASSIFRENAFGIVTGGMCAIQVVQFFLNKAYNWKLSYIFTEAYQLIMSGILNVKKSLPSAREFGVVSADQVGQAPDFSKFAMPDHFLSDMWGTLFTWEIFLKLMLCLIMFVVATNIYRKREVQF